MKFTLRFTILLVFCIIFSNVTFAQRFTIDDFYKVDSLANDAKPKDALQLIEKINIQARKDGNASLLIKSVIYRMIFQSYLEENAFDKILANLKKDISLAKQPEKSILQSLLAETYWKFYQQNQWKISQRTQVMGNVGEDINTWSVAKLTKETIKTYLESLSETTLLQNTKVDFLDNILAGDKSNRIFRPTLYDLLAHRAIDVFSNTQLTLTQAESESLDFNDSIWYSDRNDFLSLKIIQSDSSSFYIEAIKLFKNLIQFHINDGNKNALADIDLKRITFFIKRNTAPENLSNYYNSLKNLANQSKQSEVYADILFSMAMLHKNRQLEIDTNKENLIKAIDLIDLAVKVYPKSIGAQNGINLSKQIKDKELNLKIKQYILPNKPAQLYFSYKNLDTVYLKLYRKDLQNNSFYEINNSVQFLAFIEKRKPIRDWFVVLPKSSDYQTHTLVDKIEGLALGNYMLLAQSSKSMQSQAEYAVANLSSTSLNINTRFLGDSARHYFITENENGNPLKNIKIIQYKTRYKASPIISKALFTDQNGFAMDDEDEYDKAIITAGKDSVQLDLNNYNYRNNYNSYDDDDDENKKTILFTDRPIYRPGQTVFYKGLLLAKGKDKNRILTGEIIKVTFEDVNRKEIATEAKITNDYGTFNGSFIIPMGKLNGQMVIKTLYGEITVQVEEYKRPTFEIVFDKPNQKYELNDTIKVAGKANSFSGYVIANAKVTYKVYRSSFYNTASPSLQRPGYYGSQAYAKSQVAIGTTKTEDDGKFQVSFFAKVPNDKINYTYEVETDITDLNGETRTKSTSINVGKKDLQLAISSDQVLFLTDRQDSISFSVSNLNGEPIKATVKATWFLLQPPSRLMNKSPFYAEHYVLNKEKWLKNFPYDDYNNELVIEKWPVKKIAYQQNFYIENGTGDLTASSKNLNAGYYKITISAVNDLNDSISVDKYVSLYGPQPKKIEVNYEMVVAENNVVAPTEAAIFRVAGLSNKAKGYYEIYYRNTIVEKVWLDLKIEQTIIKIKPRAYFEDEFAVQFSMIFNGVAYSYLEKIKIVDKQKLLDIKFLTFRNKLQPGEKESWKLQISNKNGEKQMAEMVATLYDASLDDLKKMDWNRSISSTYNYGMYAWQYKANDLNGSILWYLRNNNYRYYSTITRTYENLNLFGFNYYGGYNSGYRNYIQKLQNQPKKGISPEASARLAELAKGKLVYGIVNDFTGYTIAGASIKIGKLTTTTDKFGVYAIDAKVGEELKVEYLGFKTNLVKVGQKKRLDIKLQTDANTLDQVVITSAGLSNKREVGNQATRLVLRGNSSEASAVIVEDNTVYNFASIDSYDQKTGIRMVNGKPIYPKPNVVPRTNFNESAFFYPQLRTDENGQIKIEFTIPQSLTRYKMMGFAHTKELKIANVSNELITQKQLAISANAPRFFREGDTILFSAKLNNLSGKKLSGDADLELKDALTGKTIQIIRKGDQSNKAFEVENTSSQVLTWELIIPTGISAITYKVIAQSGKFSDGEEMTVPVLPNSMLVTETMPINVRGNTTKTFTLDKLVNSISSTTIRNQSLTFEFTSNPIWYAVQALPYLMEYPYECSEQTFSRFYANSFATGIINSSPKIKVVFEQWKLINNGEALLSNLEKNPELKSILLEETPWVRNAENETERKKRLASLFDLNKMSNELKSNFEKLEKMQLSDGSFPWFTGMGGNRYITQHIVLGIGQLTKLKLIDEKAYPNLFIMLNKAIIYLDQQLVKDYKEELAGQRFGYLPLHYLFARSYTKQLNNNPDFVKAKDFYLRKVATNWKTFNSYQRGQTALVLSREGNKVEPAKIITLLKQTSQQSDEFGMYWKNNVAGWWWYQNPIETQAILIEAFDEVANDNKSVEEMKIWLLKNKQTNDWKTTKATTAACYALLMKGYDLLGESAEPAITIGGKTIAELGFSDAAKEAGSGYQKINIIGDAIKPAMGKVIVKNNNKSIAWGALYWQYFEQLDKITSANTGIKIKKQLFLQKTSTKGDVLTPITASNKLKVGDLVKVRMEIYSDRDMEYIHLKDMRSSGFEPINVISSYKYQDGLGYYESTKDASTNFFISYLSKGTYVFEYALRVTHAGNFSNGITSLQSMYAPEFATHSEGVRVTVK